jgi:NAD(P)-dependent dehydrogenase (short-subunit alcohol dehydrogenase family)
MSTPQQRIGSGFGAKSTAAEVVDGIDLSGKLALVTGGYSGVGLETVRALVDAGASAVGGGGRPPPAPPPGAATVGTFQAVDPCTASPETYGGSGIDGWAQRVALSALNGAACELHTTRERLVLSLDPNSGYNDVTWDHATAKKALHRGLQRAVDDAEARGTLPGWGGSILGFFVDHAPLDWVIDRIPLFDN